MRSKTDLSHNISNIKLNNNVNNITNNNNKNKIPFKPTSSKPHDTDIIQPIMPKRPQSARSTVSYSRRKSNSISINNNESIKLLNTSHSIAVICDSDNVHYHSDNITTTTIS